MGCFGQSMKCSKERTVYLQPTRPVTPKKRMEGIIALWKAQYAIIVCKGNSVRIETIVSSKSPDLYIHIPKYDDSI
jgi:hypothetical protein